MKICGMRFRELTKERRKIGGLLKMSRKQTLRLRFMDINKSLNKKFRVPVK